MTTPKATIATIDFGPFQIQGLMLADGSFAVAASQVSELFQFLNKNASRDLKALLGAGFQFLKATSELHPKAVNIITLPQFETVVLRLAIKGNSTAQELAELSIGLAMTQRFNDAFGLKFDKSDRDNWMKVRAEGILVRRTLTDEVKDFIVAHPELSENEAKFLYSNVSDTLNRLLTGHTAAYWCKLRSIAKDDLRDAWGSKQLRRIDDVERLACRKIAKGCHPIDAIEKSFDALEMEVWGEAELFGEGDKKTQSRDRQRKARANKKDLTVA